MAIAVTGTANLSRDSSTGTPWIITLNCASGGDFSTAPNAGDLILAFVGTSDYGGNGCGGTPGMATPSGWTLYNNLVPDNNGFMSTHIFYRFASASETTYSFADSNSSQALNTNMSVQAIALSGAANPWVIDPTASLTSNQTATTQAITSNAAASASSCLLTFWTSEVFTGTPVYNTPTGSPSPTGSMQFGLPSSRANSQSIAGMASTLAWTLAAGTSAVAYTTSLSSGTASNWGALSFGVKQATAVASKGGTSSMMGV